MRLLPAAALGAVCLVGSAVPAAAQDRDAATWTLRTALKASVLTFRTPEAPALFPERTGADSIWRARLEPRVRVGTRTVFTLAYEQRLSTTSSPAGFAFAGILPPPHEAPFRVRALDWTLAESTSAAWRHEIDRASVQVRAGRTDLTVGRQAIGWGRGVLFGAVDLFAPFSPLEADREWRRGVDAVRADVKLTDRTSLDLVGAFGSAWDRSAVAARARGYAGSADVEVMAGRRGRDLFAGAASSAAIGEAELHGEVAAFRTPESVPGAGGHAIWKAVIGGSYRLPIGSGVLTYVEYHYSGFGAAHPERILALLSTTGFVERYVRGDTQILSRHAVALTAACDVSPEIAWSGHWIHNPRDGSGILAPGFTYTFSDRLSLLGAFYLPYGRAPGQDTLRSEFGAAPLSALLQARVYF